MIGIKLNKQLWGWWAGILLALIQIGDSMVRLLTFGLFHTDWIAKFVQRQGRKFMYSRPIKEDYINDALCKKPKPTEWK